MQRHEDHHRLWAHALDICGSPRLAYNLRTSRSRPDVPMLSRTPVLNVSAYIQKLPNVTGDDIVELEAHLARAPMRRTIIGVDPNTKHAS